LELPLRKLVLTLQPGETPVSAESIAGAHAALTRLARTVSRLCTALAIMGGIGGLALQMKWAQPNWAGAALVIGLVGFLVGAQYESAVLARRLAEVSPIPDSMLAEAAMLCSTCPAARAYVEALREQKRELTLAEFDSLKRLATTTPAAAARQALYG
jgi:hypothetical protein